jgi:hypothetical protein
MNLGFGAIGVQYGNFYQLELNLMTYFKLTPESNGFQVGAFYRTYSEIGAILGLDLSKNLHLSYSYDYNVSGISTKSYGSHEIMLTYTLDRVFKCLNCWY